MDQVADGGFDVTVADAADILEHVRMQAARGNAEGRRRLAAPPTRTMMKHILRRVRMWLLLTFRHRFVSVGRDFYLGRGAHVRSGCVTVGDYSYIGNRCHIASEVVIGNWVMVASNVSMVGGDHRFRDVGVPSIWAGRDENLPIIVEDDAWIGHGATVMHGVRIGEGAIVAAGALVVHDVPAYAIVGGIPAEVMAQRFEGEDLDEHRRSLCELREKYLTAHVTGES